MPVAPGCAARVGTVVASTVGEIAGATATVVVAFIGLFAARRGADTVRRQTTSSTTELPAAHADAEGGQVLSREVEGYLVRFLILYLTLSAWSAFLNVARPFIYLKRFEVRIGDSGLSFVDLSIGAVYTAIFLILGGPLLRDIGRRYGIRAHALRRQR